MTTNARIESLETQVRTLKRMLFGVFGVVIVGGLLAATTLQSVPDVIQAKKFEVMNDEGVAVAVLLAGADGGLLGLRDKDGKQSGFFTASPAGGRLFVSNQNEKLVAGLWAGPEGGILGMNSSDGDGRRIALLATEEGGMLEVFNKEDKPIAAIIPRAKGGVLNILNNDGQPVAILGQGATGGELNILNDEGKTVVLIYPDVSGCGLMSICDRNEQMVAYIYGGLRSGGMINTFDKNGVITSTTPSSHFPD